MKRPVRTLALGLLAVVVSLVGFLLQPQRQPNVAAKRLEAAQALEPLDHAWRDNTLVSTLAVRISTADEPFAGTNDDVYFDIGPLAWRLHDHGFDRRRGADHTYQLPLPPGQELTLGQVLWVALSKKGYLEFWVRETDWLVCGDPRGWI